MFLTYNDNLLLLVAFCPVAFSLGFSFSCPSFYIRERFKKILCVTLLAIIIIMTADCYWNLATLIRSIKQTVVVFCELRYRPTLMIAKEIRACLNWCCLVLFILIVLHVQSTALYLCHTMKTSQMFPCINFQNCLHSTSSYLFILFSLWLLISINDDDLTSRN